MKQVFVKDAKPGMRLENDVFSSFGGSIALAKKGTVLTQRIIDILKSKNVLSIHIEGKESYSGRYYADENVVCIDPSLKNRALGTLEDIYALAEGGDDRPVSAPAIVKELDNIVEGLLNSIIDDEKTLVNIIDLKAYDDYTYHHSLSVAVLSLAIGRGLGMTEKRLVTLTKSALLHDIGKTAIPKEILNKESPLTDSEYARIKTHSLCGANLLSRAGINDPEIWKIVLHHHEKIDGSGYPKGLKGKEIPLMSSIIAVADVYDALTSRRPYRKPMQPAEAVEYVMAGSESAFGFPIVRAFLNKIQLYAVGSYVKLSDGRIAQVQKHKNIMRPVVMDAATGTLMDLYWDRAYLNLTIADYMPDYLAIF